MGVAVEVVLGCSSGELFGLNVRSFKRRVKVILQIYAASNSGHAQR